MYGSSAALGIARASIEDAIQFGKQREQFGKPIAHNQAIQWMIADMTTEYESAWLLTHRAAWMKDGGQRYTREEFDQRYRDRFGDLEE